MAAMSADGSAVSRLDPPLELLVEAFNGVSRS